MDFVNNLSFDEIMLRYAVMIVLGIVAGVTMQYWMIIPTMAVFLMAVLGYCPVKASFTRRKAAHS